MAVECPSKSDIQLIFKRLRSLTCNKVCFDCNAKNPTWASVTYGVFICIDCSAVHRSLGVHLTFVRSTQLDTNWTWLQLRQMQLGGNANATTFFRQHNCTTTDAQQKYNSRAAQLYKEKLHQIAIQAMKLHGTQLHVGPQPEAPPVEDTKEVDFFAEHTELGAKQNTWQEFVPEFEDGGPQDTRLGNRGQPSVQSVLSGARPDASFRPTIGGRKPARKGLGAHRVKADFAELEREAVAADEQRACAPEPPTAEEETRAVASVRLAYQDLSIQARKEEDRLRQSDPRKAQQVERLGMGLSGRTHVSHSALSDMRSIEQEVPSKPASDSFFDDFHFSTPSSSFSMYKGNSSESKSLEAMFGEGTASRDRCGTSRAWGQSEPENRQPVSSPATPSSFPTSTEAQKKFGSAKAISSDQFFGDSEDSSKWERKANLSRFEGSSSISSADYFGTPSPRGGSQMQTPDLEDVKESVRQGVTRVAGKLSSLANGVMSSIQDRYGY